ncbi:hypothetical protein AXG93_2175s1380 [Marchantia polymorpha subsp. ruderalis]|uniref:Uncharacterized protein n=1 Tax=Marchantia polymorpha subsp. ruderalis TaxID=1480154 RepID=A0A176W823_MARPO|nr:hypothetical protein AXG93_2175s1380 [Marchantia polymorpha subsp. ruderalis]
MGGAVAPFMMHNVSAMISCRALEQVACLNCGGDDSVLELALVIEANLSSVLDQRPCPEETASSVLESEPG